MIDGDSHFVKEASNQTYVMKDGLSLSIDTDPPATWLNSDSAAAATRCQNSH